MNRKSIIALVLAVASWLPMSAGAQQDPDMIALLRAQIGSDRQAVVALNMDLSEQQAE